MNAVGRQMRSGSSTVHHQRQYSDNFLDSSSSNGRWLQSNGLQHLHSSTTALPGFQDYGFFGGGGGGARMFRNSGRGGNGGNGGNGGSELFSEPSTPPVCSRSSSQRKIADDQVSPNELSPGILDLHSLDTELLPEMSHVPAPYDGTSFYPTGRGRSFDDSEQFLTNKANVRSRGLPDNNLLKSFSTDKDKSAVAKIKVVVRKRPLNKKELGRKEEDIVTIEPNSNSLTVHETKQKVDLTEYVEKHEFVFDAVLDEEVSNDEVYRETVEPVVPAIFQRTKATCFAYGQTGKEWENLHHAATAPQSISGYTEINASYISQPRKLCMREDGKQQVCIVGLQEYRVSSVDLIRDLIEKGNATRSTGTTGANEESSRSHAILQLAIKKSADGSESKPARVVGKLSFIDLAGSERGADTTDNDKQTRMEGAEINKSLLALKECIRALDSDQGHIPFRGSKLTEVLRDSFVGDSRTVMISCISPNSGSCEHTLNTLRYADRVKSLSKGGNNAKKDPLLATLNIRESTTVPLSSVLPTSSTMEATMMDAPIEHSRFGWIKQMESESSLPYNIDRVSSGREEDFDFSEEFYEPEKPSWKKNVTQEAFHVPPKEDKIRKAEPQTKWKDMADFDGSLDPEQDLNALLKEEEDLVSAHRKTVEETIDIVKEEMKLLVEADQPGNQLDDYISKLNAILSHKAAGILQLQNRLASFQRRLNEHNVLAAGVYGRFAIELSWGRRIILSIQWMKEITFEAFNKLNLMGKVNSSLG
ncbi:hypothetical protein Syun_011891 [Stephania yunnanensis]|uniref:Kinesin-like protein n=1 Tax=Stephania yunnanensis TaxID=152371 RepID=A0AAP0JYE1_9MAGN